MGGERCGVWIEWCWWEGGCGDEDCEGCGGESHCCEIDMMGGSRMVGGYRVRWTGTKLKRPNVVGRWKTLKSQILDEAFIVP